MLISTLIFVGLFVLGTAHVSFVFPPGQSLIYTGYLWEGSEKVYIRPLLQATAKGQSPPSNEICGIKSSTVEGNAAPIYAKLIDRTNGLSELFVPNDFSARQTAYTESIYYLEAYDCSNPPTFSEKVPIRIHVISGGGPFFIEPSYTFIVSQASYVDSFVGQVQALQQPNGGGDSMYSAICNYQLSRPDLPFSIDRKGIIRTRQKLETRLHDKPYVFQVIAEDCHRPTPRMASVDVVVRQITLGCQAGWKGLPTYMEYHGSGTSAGKLLLPYKLDLEVCVNLCDSPKILARLELKSALNGYKLQTAATESCLQDPEHVLNQQLLCGLHPTTLTNLLPNPEQSIVSQLSGPVLGNPPRLSAPTMVWRFNASTRSVWQVDPKYLNAEENTNAFDNDFTVSFWLRRHSGASSYPESEPEEETVLCSQDLQEPTWRFMSISFKKCHLIVRLLAPLQNGPDTIPSSPRKPSVWTFGPLPDEYCSPAQISQATWHHYAITFSRNPWGATSELVSLLLDGKDLGAIGTPTETRLPGIPPFIPAEHRAKPQLTIGACFDPHTRLTRHHMNADLAGLAVLTERAEAINNLRCVAQCGESLIVPDILKHLKSDVTVDLESNAITVTAQNVSHIVDILHAIAYVRPQSGLSHGYTPNAIQTRLLNLTTYYSCESVIEIPPSEIKLHIFPERSESTHKSQVAQPLGSMWMTDANKQQQQMFDRSPIAQANEEKKAWIRSKDLGSMGSPPLLMIEGSDVLITEPPIEEPGIQLFPDVVFQLPGLDQSQDAYLAAAAVPLDGCLVWIVSSEISDSTNKQIQRLSNHDEGRIEWSLSEIKKHGLYAVNDKHGVQFRGQRPAGDYAKILKTLHYLPPESVSNLRLKDKFNMGSANGDDIKFSARIGLICTSEMGKNTTSHFFASVLIEPANMVLNDLSTNEALQNLAPDNDLLPLGLEQSHQPLTKRGPRRLAARDAGMEPPNEAATTTKHPSKNSRNLAIGLSVTAVVTVAAIALIIGLYVRNHDRSGTKAHQAQPGRRRRFPRQPADFGGSSLKQDPTLRLTANPIGEVEYRGIGVVSEDLYGSSRNIAPRQHIFSPPLPLLDQQANDNPSWANARLAGLDEFEEDYMEEPSEEFFDEQNDPSSNDTEEMSGHNSDTHEVNVHEWIDDEDPLKVHERPPGSPDLKCKLVAVCTPNDFGSPVASL